MADALARDRARLLELLTERSFERRKVVLSSGKESDFYIDCKRTALLAEGHFLIGRLLLEAIQREAPAAVARGRADAGRGSARLGGEPHQLPGGHAAARVHRPQGAQGPRHGPVDRGPEARWRPARRWPSWRTW